MPPNLLASLRFLGVQKLGLVFLPEVFLVPVGLDVEKEVASYYLSWALLGL